MLVYRDGARYLDKVTLKSMKLLAILPTIRYHLTKIEASSYTTFKVSW